MFNIASADRCPRILLEGDRVAVDNLATVGRHPAKARTRGRKQMPVRPDRAGPTAAAAQVRAAAVAVSALVIIAALLSGCAGPNQAVSTSTAATSTNGAATQASVKPPETPTSVPLPAGHVLRAPATLYSDCSMKTDNQFPTDAQVFNPKTGRNVAMPRPTLEAGQVLDFGECTVGGDIDHIRVYYVVTISTPSSGLTPESKVSSILAFDPFSPGPPQTAPLPEDFDTKSFSDTILPTTYGFTFDYFPHQDHEEYVGIDGATLAKSFTIDVTGHDVTLNFKGLAIGGNSIKLFDASNGALIFQSHDWDGALPYPDGFILTNTTTDPLTSAYYEMNDKQLKTQASFPLAADKAYLFGNTLLSRVSHSMEVRDVVDDRVILHRDGADFDGLHIRWASVAGNYLYIANDSDNPVIDLTTSQKVSSGWRVRPTDVINQNWILVKNESSSNSGGTMSPCLANDGNYQLTCSNDDATLRYAPNGNYAGPWY